MKIDLQTVLIAAAVVGAGALVLMPRRQATATSTAPQATGAGAAFVNMSLGDAYSRLNIDSVMPSSSWAGISMYTTPYLPGLGTFAK